MTKRARRTTYHAEEGRGWREGDFASFGDNMFFTGKGKPSMVLRVAVPKAGRGGMPTLVLFWTVFAPRGQPADLRALDEARDVVLNKLAPAAAEQYVELKRLPKFRLEVVSMPPWLIRKIPGARVVEPSQPEVG